MAEVDVWEVAADQLDVLLTRATIAEKLLLVAKLGTEVESHEDYAANRSKYLFTEEVSSRTVESCIRSLSRASRAEPGCDIEVVFNSPGGSCIAGLALFDFILSLRAVGHTVTTSSMGMAASMGGILLQAGTWRTITPNGFMLIHEVSSSTWGKISEQQDDLEFSKRLEDRCLKILAERSTLSLSGIRRKCARKDWWLDAEEALKFGFVDEILTPDLSAEAAAA